MDKAEFTKMLTEVLAEKLEVSVSVWTTTDENGYVDHKVSVTVELDGVMLDEQES